MLIPSTNKTPHSCLTTPATQTLISQTRGREGTSVLAVGLAVSLDRGPGSGN